jgi:imidazolonepropionase-like amidohydrolase
LVLCSAVHLKPELMSQAELPPREILVAATRDSAKSIYRELDLSALQSGKLADMAVIKSDPLTGSRHKPCITAIIHNGVFYQPDRFMREIDLLEQLQKSARQKN